MAWFLNQVFGEQNSRRANTTESVSRLSCAQFVDFLVGCDKRQRRCLSRVSGPTGFGAVPQ